MAEEKIRIVLDGLRGEATIAELCRCEGTAESLYYSWSKEFLEADKRRVVVIARERKGRLMTTVTNSEADGVAFVSKVVRPGSTVHADEASHWDALHAKFNTMRINHSKAYSLHGACTNQAESFLARLRRMVDGQHHHVSPQHLHQYAAKGAWMEDHRRTDNGTLARNVVTLAMAHPVSRQWKGYWQRSAP